MCTADTARAALLVLAMKPALKGETTRRATDWRLTHACRRGSALIVGGLSGGKAAGSWAVAARKQAKRIARREQASGRAI